MSVTLPPGPDGAGAALVWLPWWWGAGVGVAGDGGDGGDGGDVWFAEPLWHVLWPSAPTRQWLQPAPLAAQSACFEHAVWHLAAGGGGGAGGRVWWWCGGGGRLRPRDSAALYSSSPLTREMSRTRATAAKTSVARIMQNDVWKEERVRVREAFLCARFLLCSSARTVRNTVAERGA
jgi:hypothetical protein